MKVFFVFLAFILQVYLVHAGHILALFNSYSQSHQIMGREILKALARKGHKVTMMSAFPLETPVENYKDINMKGLIGETSVIDDLMLEFLEDPNIISYKGLTEFAYEVKWSGEQIFKDDQFWELVKTKPKFDVIFMDMFYNDMHLVLSHVFDAPIIACSSAGTNELAAKLTNSPMPYAYVPHKWLSFNDHMDLFQRIKNTLMYVSIDVFGLGTRGHDGIVQKYFPGAPTTEELRKNVAVVFSNSHFSYETPRPLVPNLIPVGGCHVQEIKPLPKDIQELLDTATNGAIFFSFGSNVKSSYLKNGTLTNIFRAFAKTNFTVLMKWEVEDHPEKPKNVITRKWFPQNDILAHKNVKLFITHGGLMSTIEAIHHGVPLIGIPIFADQHSNIPQAVHGGYALQLDFFNITEDGLSQAIKEITENASYSLNIKKRSEYLNNQPINPLDLAVYWSEFVMKYKGAESLKTNAGVLSWYQLYLLDVILVLAVLLLLIVLLISFVVITVCKCIKTNFVKSPKNLKGTKYAKKTM